MNGLKKKPRPLGVTILMLVVLYVAATNLIRLVQTIRLWSYLNELLSFSPVYLALTGLIWGVVFIFLAWGLWRGLPFVPWMVIGVVVLYSIYYWVDRFFLPGPNMRNSNWTFSLLLQVILIIWIMWILLNRKARIYFGETNEY